MPIFLYRTTNLLNGKFYYGVHTGPVDGESLAKTYLGSGALIKRAIRKHGRENFKREVLQIFEDYETAYKREAEVVTEELIKDPLCYNMKAGGWGGWKMPESAKQKISEWQRGRKWPGRGEKIGNTLRGVPKTEAHRAALRKPKQMTQKTCPHCGTIGAGANMTRYHFDKCIGVRP